MLGRPVGGLICCPRHLILRYSLLLSVSLSTLSAVPLSRFCPERPLLVGVFLWAGVFYVQRKGLNTRLRCSTKSNIAKQATRCIVPPEPEDESAGGTGKGTGIVTVLVYRLASRG